MKQTITTQVLHEWLLKKNYPNKIYNYSTNLFSYFPALRFSDSLAKSYVLRNFGGIGATFNDSPWNFQRSYLTFFPYKYSRCSNHVMRYVQSLRSCAILGVHLKNSYGSRTSSQNQNVKNVNLHCVVLYKRTKKKKNK